MGSDLFLISNVLGVMGVREERGSINCAEKGGGISDQTEVLDEYRMIGY